jgi:platelet-activating factor acetylhydrolase
MLDVITTAQNGAESALQIANPNPLWQRVDLSRIGVFGHSFGGATGIMALDSDPRIRAAVVLDGWMVPVPEAIIDRGASKPLLYLGQESWGEPLNYEKLARFEANSSGLVTTEILAGTKHMDFSDSPHLSSFAKRVGFAGSVPAEQLRAKLNADILRFFADYVDADSIEQRD